MTPFLYMVVSDYGWNVRKYGSYTYADRKLTACWMAEWMEGRTVLIDEYSNVV